MDDAHNAAAGAKLGALTLELQDADGNVLTDAAGDVTVALGSNTAGASLLGTSTAPAVNGVATLLMRLSEAEAYRPSTARNSAPSMLGFDPVVVRR